ncbi:MAG: hypothetical protein V3575_00280 [Candidatus Absconditabacteria bacterium]
MVDKKLLLKLKLKINEYSEATPIAVEEKKYYMDFFQDVLKQFADSGLLIKNQLNDEIKGILRVFIAFLMKIKKYGQALDYIEYFEDSGWKYRTKALIYFRSLKYPDETQSFKISKDKGATNLKIHHVEGSEKNLPYIFDEVAEMLHLSLGFIDKNVQHTLDIFQEYFDKVFGLADYQTDNERIAYIQSLKNSKYFARLLEDENFQKYISKYVDLNLIGNQESGLSVKDLQDKIKLLEEELAQKEKYIKQLEQGIKDNDNEELSLLTEGIENINISIGIIGGKKDERSLDFLKEDKSRAVESGINPSNVSFRYYQAWEKSSRSSIYTIIGQNDIIIIGKNDHIWNDIPSEYNGNTQGIYNFLKNEKDSNGNHLCKFVYNGVPDESSTKRPKLSKSTLRTLIVQGINELLREKLNDLKTME